MVHFLQCSSAHMPLGSLFFSILLLASSMEIAVANPNAKSLPQRLLEHQEEAGTSKGHGDEEEIRVGGMKGRVLIGSRPPRCERVCSSCGHCEAVQVPVVPQDRHHHHKTRAAAHHDAAAMLSYKVSGITDYKPLSWKCRCGGSILDP